MMLFLSNLKNIIITEIIFICCLIANAMSEPTGSFVEIQP